ncbi:MAG: hypothetical protein U5S82_21845 [Gammaproteobacteria bacterium]|nr:hypothetical protein [Gammaproteobacteria bacterium]
MRYAHTLLAALLAGATTGLVWADVAPRLPADYPSHRLAGECDKGSWLTRRQSLEQHLDAYNHTRLEVAAMLRQIVAEYDLEAATRQHLLSFAQTFEEMAAAMPAPDPDSNAFRNFDFRLGLSFAAVAAYLNDNEALAARFHADRLEPETTVGRYLARLDLSRDTYEASLERAREDATEDGHACS